MRRHELTDAQWEKVAALLPRGRGRRSIRGDRSFINAVIWIAKTGAPWRDLPERFGSWKTVFNRFSEWAKANRWGAIFKVLAISDDEVGSLMDGSVVRSHQDSCSGEGGPKKTR
jgi:transposase